MLNKLKELREWTTCIFSVALVPLFFWGLWSAQQVLKNQRAEIETNVRDNYVSKSWFTSVETTTNQRLDDLTRGINQVQQDVATVKGELSAGHNRNHN